MNRWIRSAAVTVTVLAGGLVTAWLSQAPWSLPEGGRAQLRLAWSGRPERIERCRTLTDAELEGVPAHMRQRVRCEGRTATYRLDVVVNGTRLLTDTLAGGGARRDRPIHLLRELPLPPGRHRVQLSVMRIDSVPGEADADTAAALPGSRDAREREERARARREALPPVLAFDTTLALGAGAVALVTYDPDRKRLVLLDGGAR